MGENIATYVFRFQHEHFSIWSNWQGNIVVTNFIANYVSHVLKTRYLQGGALPLNPTGDTAPRPPIKGSRSLHARHGLVHPENFRTVVVTLFLSFYTSSEQNSGGFPQVLGVKLFNSAISDTAR